jgi:tetratricopeptide (TPR) repeat protein
MLTALALCLSRAGVVCLFGAIAVGAVLTCSGATRATRFGGVLLLICLALGLAAWFGLGETHGRLATLWKHDAHEEERWRVWAQTAPSVRAFPLWGAGFTTFPFLEQMSRSPHAGPDFFYDHAHNNYLEMLLEGGLVGFALLLAALGLGFARAVRAYLRHRDAPAGAIALGGIVALTTVALHSFVDFGLYLPAVAVLVAVLVAQLAALGAEGAGEPAAAPSPGGGTFLPRTATALLATAGVLAVAWVLTAEGSKVERAERYRRAAAALEPAQEPSARQRGIAYLRAATRLAPADATLQMALADALNKAFQTERASLQERTRAASAAGLLLAWADLPGPFGPACRAAVAVAGPGLLAGEDRRLTDEYLRPALARYVLARNLCPLLERPHVSLAAHAPAEVPGEPASVHLERARLLVPYNARIWFLCGAQQLQEGARDQAWHSWRRSLECSSENLEEILARSRKHLGPEALAASVLPADPELLYQAAVILDRQGQSGEALLRLAVELLRQRPGGPKDDALLLEARALVRLSRTEEALRAFERFSKRSPGRAEWRYEFAQVLHDQGRLDEARQELRTLLQQQPDHRAGGELHRTVLRRLAEGR